MHNCLYTEIKVELFRQDKTQKDLADCLGIQSSAGITERLRGKTQWRLDECYKVLDYLNIPYSEFTRFFPNCERR